MPYAIELLDITKRFARTVANDDVTLRVVAGSIHALVGENGAGKTTLMETLYGLYQPDSGSIMVHGKKVVIRSPHDSIKLGIGMVHQHFMLVPTLTVLENIVLGMETTRHLLMDLKKSASKVEAIAEKFSLHVPLDERVEHVGVGVQQRVEILKAIYRKAEVLILDEPTAVLTPQESTQLFKILRGLRDEGKTIILITHKLNEVMEISDRISVMRKGRMVGELETARTNPQEIAQLMVGRPVLLRVEKGAAKKSKPALQVRNLSFVDRRGVSVLSDVSFEVASGEILGIAGVEGNGQSQLIECIAGLSKPATGSIMLDGTEISSHTVREVFENGIAHVPEDRIKRGLVIDMSICENLILGLHNRPQFGGPFSLDRAKIKENARNLIERYDIRPPDPEVHTRGLSGGNQQKVIIARELSRNAKVIIASQPTRGVDIGGIEFIHRTLIASRDAGIAILLVSADLNEILGLSDRIAVMYGGKITRIFPDNKVQESELGLYMTGSKGNDEKIPA